MKIREVDSIPDKKAVLQDKFPELLEAAMNSTSGCIAADFDDIKESRNMANALHQWLKKRGLVDVFEVRQRRCTLFVKENRGQ